MYHIQNFIEEMCVQIQNRTIQTSNRPDHITVSLEYRNDFFNYYLSKTHHGPFDKKKPLINGCVLLFADGLNKKEIVLGYGCFGESNNISKEIRFSSLRKDKRHSHYWIEDNNLFESYHTTRGLRYRGILKTEGLENNDNVSENLLEYIEKEFIKSWAAKQ